ncbi:MAG: NAD(P)H-dependent oxidoreductase [Clostridia bacterium]
MKKLLYVSVNSKPEQLSASKTVARAFINKYLEKNKNYQLEELDLYTSHIPRLKYQYFDGRNAMIKKDAIANLSPKQQEEAHKIGELTDQFVAADMIVFAAPMWSLSFPAPLKEYLDCIVMDGKTISLSKNKVDGLLDDKPRKVVYVQSSGAELNPLTKMILNRGVNYVKDLMHLMGIKKFDDILVDGTGYTELEKNIAVEKAISKIDMKIEFMEKLEKIGV